MLSFCSAPFDGFEGLKMFLFEAVQTFKSIVQHVHHEHLVMQKHFYTNSFSRPYRRQYFNAFLQYIKRLAKICKTSGKHHKCRLSWMKVQIFPVVHGSWRSNSSNNFTCYLLTSYNLLPTNVSEYKVLQYLSQTCTNAAEFLHMLELKKSAAYMPWL